MRTIVLLQVVFLSCLTNTTVAIVTSDTPGSHLTIAGETVFGVNLDGVFALASVPQFVEPQFDNLQVFCTGSLVADDYALTAAHCFDMDANGRVDMIWKFFRVVMAFETSDGPMLLPLDPFQAKFYPSWNSRNADLAILPLSDTAPSQLPRYAVYGGSDEIAKPNILVGYGLTGYGADGETDEYPAQHPEKRAGRNRYEAVASQGDVLVYDFDSGMDAQNALSLVGTESDLGFGVDEVNAALGDSGGPVFVHGTIAGVTASGDRVPDADVNDVTDSSWGELGFDTRVSAYRSWILEQTDSHTKVLDELGDFNFDGTLDAEDLDALAAQIRNGALVALYDLDANDSLDVADHRAWVIQQRKTWYGDANLDGEFDTIDFTHVFEGGKYETGEVAGWEQGDWDGDGNFGSRDFVTAFIDGGYELGPRQDVAAIPEPLSALLFVMGLIGVTAGRRCHQN